MIEIRQGKRVFKIYADSVPVREQLGFAYHTAFAGQRVPPLMHKFHRQTIWVDLRLSEDDIMKGFKTDTRNEIRRALREGCVCEELSDIHEFVDYYNTFAQFKKLALIDNATLDQYKDIHIYKCSVGEMPLVMHANIIDRENGIARLLYSASVRLADGVDKKLVGNANRLLHYHEMLEFKRQGLTVYDFAGINEDARNAEQYSITRFKKSFGGEVKDVLFLTSMPAYIVDSVSAFRNGEFMRKVKGRIHRMLHPRTGAIWILHRVCQESDESLFEENRALSISVADLESKILRWRKQGYEFVSLDEACRRQLEGSSRKYVCVTFDDGYLDNLTIAYPLLKRLDVPFAVYVVGGFPERTAKLWWYWIEELAKRDSSVTFGALHDKFINMRPSQLEAHLAQEYPDFEQWNAEALERLALSREQVAGLAADPLCTIGLHTLSHCRLDRMDRDEQLHELQEGLRVLESITGKPVKHVSYPYGAYNADTEDICRELGFASAADAWGGDMRRGDKMITAKRTKVF